MAADTNMVVLVGRLTRDAEIRHTSGGTAVANMRLAFSSREKHDGVWKDHSNFVDVVLFGRDGVHDYLVRGQQVAVSGRLQFREWTAKDGTTRGTIEVVVAELQLLGGDRSGHQSAAVGDLPSEPTVFAGKPVDNDDIPF